MTHRSQEVRKAFRGSTSDELLALPDREIAFENYDLVGEDDFSYSFSRNGGVTRCVTPLGISSRDGWKDDCVRSLSRSRSLPASSTCLNSPQTSITCRSPGEERCEARESINWWSNNSNSEQRDGFLLKNYSKSFIKKSSYSSCAGKEKNHLVLISGQKPDDQIYYGGEKRQLAQDTDMNCNGQRYQCGEKSGLVQDTDIKPDQSRISLEGVDLSKWRASFIEGPVNDPLETTLSVYERGLSSENSCPENTPIHYTEGISIFSHCTTTEAESPASSKEVGKPSPIFVLKPPFVEKSSSSSDALQKISTDLHRHRMQLQLPKLESSDAYCEGSEMIVLAHCNSSLYFLLNCSNAHLDVFSQAWSSPDCVVSPPVFDELEKKYGEQITGPMLDQKLLSDRIKMGLKELLLPHMDPHPWVRLGKPIGLQWKGEHLAEELSTFLNREDKMISPEMVVVNDMKWLDLGDDMNMIVNELEKGLFDELMTEVVIT